MAANTTNSLIVLDSNKMNQLHAQINDLNVDAFKEENRFASFSEKLLSGKDFAKLQNALDEVKRVLKEDLNIDNMRLTKETYEHRKLCIQETGLLIENLYGLLKNYVPPAHYAFNTPSAIPYYSQKKAELISSLQNRISQYENNVLKLNLGQKVLVALAGFVGTLVGLGFIIFPLGTWAGVTMARHGIFKHTHLNRELYGLSQTFAKLIPEFSNVQQATGAMNYATLCTHSHP